MARKKKTKREDDDDVIYPTPASPPPKPSKRAEDFKVEIYIRSKLDPETSITPKQCRIVTLQHFTAMICHKLPREVNDQIYDELLDPSTMHGIERASRESLSEFPVCTTIQDKEDAPVIIRPHLVDPQFAREVITRFFERYQHFGVQSPRDIGSFFNTDFFGIGLKATDTPLSALKVIGILDKDDWDMVNLSTLAKDFELLLDPKVRTSKDFKLVFHLKSSVYLFVEDPEITRLATLVHGIMQQLKPFIDFNKSMKGSLTMILKTEYGIDQSLMKNKDRGLDWWKKRVTALAHRISYDEDGSHII